MNKRVVDSTKKRKVLAIIYVEGDTEVEFYKKMIAYFKSKYGRRLPCEVKICNLKGVGQYQTKAHRIFTKKIKVDYPDSKYIYKIFLCYDTDVFEFAKKPLVNWEEVVKSLYESGAHNVCQVKADKSIEDWFLYDSIGLKKFLKAPKKDDISNYKGLDGLKKLFFKYNKTYIKGNHCKGLVDCFDMKKIFPNICNQIHVICETMGMNCSDGKCEE